MIHTLFALVLAAAMLFAQAAAAQSVPVVVQPGLVYSSTTGHSLDRLDPNCTAALCPIYREAAIRFKSRLDEGMARSSLESVARPAAALPHVGNSALSVGPGWLLTAALITGALTAGFVMGALITN